MTDRVEVYVRIKKVKVGRSVYVGAPSDGVYVIAETTHYCMDKERFEGQELMPETDRLALKAASEYAEEIGLPLRIYNVSTLRGKTKARLRGISKLPAIVIGKIRFEGESASELLRDKIEPRFGQESTRTSESGAH